MLTLATSSTLCSFIGVMLPPQQINFGNNINLLLSSNLYRRKLEVKHACCCGGFQIKEVSSVQDDFVYRQNFTIKSYEIDANGMASIQTLMNYFQESAINHFKTFGLHRDGYGSTIEMIKRNLIWIFTHTTMEVYRYPI
ncbi:hypothetical protein PIB30_083031, partial [Stylosanthes scabra]|nr:hypothetical protein [Stylosanthes scabra]